MPTATISQVKVNPMAVFNSATDFPVQIQSRNKTAGYFVGKDLFEKMISYIEDIEDREAIQNADYKNGTKLEDLELELGFN